nr:MAG TPA: hypothetical protein [Caudoviricetes sp.]DAL44929.1 MAG TPA_asm: hypothetical protein [Caudoviricetes sp.]
MSGQSLLSNANGMPARAFTLTIGEKQDEYAHDE